MSIKKFDDFRLVESCGGSSYTSCGGGNNNTQHTSCGGGSSYTSCGGYTTPPDSREKQIMKKRAKGLSKVFDKEYCEECGEKLIKDAKFCHNCGNKL